MDAFAWIGARLPVGSAKPEIASCRAKTQAANDDQRALAHLTLYKIYSLKASEAPFLSPFFKHLAIHHLKEAVLWSKILPEPLGILASMQLQEGELWDGLSNSEEAIKRQRFFMQLGTSPPTDIDRLTLSKYLYLAGEACWQLGRLQECRDWMLQAWQEFASVDLAVRSQGTTLEDDFILRISYCLVFEMRYEEAYQFISGVLRDELFSAFQSETRHGLRALQRVLAELVIKTPDSQVPTGVGEFFRSFTEKIRRCETAEKIRALRSEILDKINAPEVTLQIEKLVGAAVAALEKGTALLRQRIPPVENKPPVEPAKEELAKIGDPAWRETMENVVRAAEALNRLHQQREEAAAKDLQESLREAEKEQERATSAIRSIASRVYHVAIGDRLRWTWWRVQGLLIQAVALGYFFEKFVHKLVDQNATLAFTHFHYEPNELAFDLGVTLVVFALGKFVEKWIDKRALDKYKRALVMLVAKRAEAVWKGYNDLLKASAKAEKAFNDLEAKLKSIDESAAAS